MGYCIFLRKGETHTTPSTGILASDLAVGDIVKLTEGGTPVEYIVVNQGIPENSSLYDSSCNGTWLLRKDCYDNDSWSDGNVNTYADSAVHTRLNEDFFNTFGNIEKTTIKQVKIPYCVGEDDATIRSGSNGLTTKIFLLGGYEVGFTTSDVGANLPVDGTKLNYFLLSSVSGSNDRRIAYYNGNATIWWLRSPDTNGSNYAFTVSRQGSYGTDYVSGARTIRPALILPFTAKFDKDTKILKG